MWIIAPDGSIIAVSAVVYVFYMNSMDVTRLRLRDSLYYDIKGDLRNEITNFITSGTKMLDLR